MAWLCLVFIGVIMTGFVEQLNMFLEASGFSLLTLIVVIPCGLVSARCILKIIKHSLLRTSLDKLLIKFLLTIIKVIVYVGLLLYCCTIIGIPLTGVVTALSAVTLAIGLAIQDIIAGVASGMMLVSIHPFKVGDYVEAGGFGGSVKEVNLFHTVLTTPDNKQMMIPNKNIFAEEIVNYSHNDTRRLDLIFTADYDEDRENVKRVIEGVALSHPLVLKSPESMVRVNELNASDISYLCRVWVMNQDYWTVKFDLTELVLDALAKNNINIPFPQLTLSYREGNAKEARND